MFDVAHSVKTEMLGHHDKLLEKPEFYDRRFRIWKEQSGDQAALKIAARNSRIIGDYLSGKFTMAEIGDREGLSRERVRQIIAEQAPEHNKVLKVRREASKAKKLISKESRRKAAFFRLWGCDREKFAYILSVFPDAKLRFKENKGNAHTMNRPWKMTFLEWATCWIESGKVQLRGHKGMSGSGQYWMSLIDPAMGYVVGNVRIVHVIEVLEERDRRKAGIAQNRVNKTRFKFDVSQASNQIHSGLLNSSNRSHTATSA